MDLPVATLLVVLLCKVDHITSTDTQDDHHPGFLFDNHPGYILSLPANTKVKQMSTKVSGKMDCVFACVGHPWCRSVNFKIAAEKDGRHICELIATDKYTKPKYLKKDEKFTHLNIKNPCEAKPCLNKGKCLPHENRLDYWCKCKNGFTGEKCQTGDGHYSTSNTSFLYSLYNTYGYDPVKLTLTGRYNNHAIYGGSNYGPIFGAGHDLYIPNYPSTNNCHTYMGYTYYAPRGCSYGGGSCTIFAGSYQFTLSDIEVFYETNN